jgi:hypothetical protein
MLTAVESGAVTLFHNNAAKLATTATGIDVTGTVTADGLTVSTPLGDTPASIVTTTGGSFLQFTDVNTTAGRSPLVGAITDGLSFYTSAGSYSQKLGIDSLGGITGTSQAGGHVVFNEGGVDADFLAFNTQETLTKPTPFLLPFQVLLGVLASSLMFQMAAVRQERRVF